jgi:2-polyprenyl-3-methyl-5-hydroxy-6-metoxy-1,4-benzoquinol methylase
VNEKKGNQQSQRQGRWQNRRPGEIKTYSTPVTEQRYQEVPCVFCGGTHFKQQLLCRGFAYVRCTRCGLVQMNPQPVMEDVHKRYGENYLNYETKNEAAFLQLQEKSLEDVGFYKQEKSLGLPLAAGAPQSGRPTPQITPGPRVLDIGCATGALLEKLAQRNWQTTGVEISLPQAEYARRERNLDIRTETLEKNHFPDSSFDVVLASHVIEHVNNPLSFVQEVHRILKKDGCFYVTTPNINSFQAFLFGSRWRSAIFDHLYLFSVKTLSAMLVKAGFRVEQVVTWGGLAKGSAPGFLKTAADFLAKPLNVGDVMILRARRQQDPDPAL